MADVQSALSHLPSGQAGVRIHGIRPLRRFLQPEGSIGSIAMTVLGASCRAVRAILFDKSPDMNWSLSWHQDRTICVAERIDVEGFGPWTRKAGMQHVEPPFALLARMVTLRVHLDDVPCDNAPLLIAPGSHLEGRIPIESYNAVVLRCGTFACLAEAGDIWLYSTAILHASEASAAPKRRRVLQVDYAADDLPGGLAWLGV